MKRFFATLLALMMVFTLVFMVACGGETGGSPDPNPTKDPNSSATPAPPPPSLEPTSGGQLIIGQTTELSGDWETTWTNNAADKDVLDLIDATGTVVTNRDAEYIWNESVLTDHKEETDADGNKTYTLTIRDDMKWTNGEPITAADYVARVLLFSSPVILKAGASATYGMHYVGYDDFKAGKTNVFSGVRLIDSKTFSVTVDGSEEKGYLPFYYDINYASIAALPTTMWLGEDIEVADDGEGAYFKCEEIEAVVEKVDDAGKPVVDAEGNPVTENLKIPEFDARNSDLQDTINAARFATSNRQTYGPYKIVYYDNAAKQCVLEINENYHGNFEGQKPQIERLVMVKTDTATQFDLLKTGQIDLIIGLTDGDEINNALDLESDGGYSTVNYERAGYGKIMFQCDFGPTQFVKVRQALAHLLDRNAFCDTFCQGYGSVVNGPYGVAQWMYKESEEELNSKLNSYSYDVNKAIQLLEEDGWVLDEKGNPYSGTGTRYKEVTAEEAGDYQHNVKAGGKTLMPLIIEWCSSSGNPVSELIDTMLRSGDQTAQAGVVINRAIMDFSELLNYMYRDDSQGEKYGVPTYGMYNLATSFYPQYDFSYNFSLDEAMIKAGLNMNFIFDEQLDKLSMEMVYGVEYGDDETFRQKFVDFVVRWNELLPEIPLYSNIYYDVFNEKLQGYENISAFWNAVAQIPYCTVSE